jgi:hypothetical protein
MDWTSGERYSNPIGTHCHMSYPKKVSRVSFTLHLSSLLHNFGFSYQKARFVSNHLNAAKHLEWRQSEWLWIVRHARQRKALRLFDDAASFVQWGSLSYTWASRGQQPAVPTRGKLRAYKVSGFIDDVLGQFFIRAIRALQRRERCGFFARGLLANTATCFCGARRVIVSHD